MVVSGNCNCGAIKVVVDVDELPKSYICYCTNCQRSCGSAFSVNLALTKDKLTITGTPKTFADSNTDSGNTIYRNFCGNCGSPVHSDPDPSNATGLTFLKGSLFLSTMEPQGEGYLQNKHHWMATLPALDPAKAKA